MPDFSRSNPFQSLLYGDLRQRGARVHPLHDWSRELAPEDEGTDLSQYALHVHWTSPILRGATHVLDALQQLDQFKRNVDSIKRRGASVIWTVHNVLPHEHAFGTVEVELCQVVAGCADVIHVMDESTPLAAQGHYDLPHDKVRVVPHPSYIGVYPDAVTRDAARRQLGLAGSDVALLVLGEVRPYKGIDTLLPAFDQAWARHPHLRLLVAGRPGKSASVQYLTDLCAADSRVTSSFGFVDPQDIQVWMRAADIAVLPYNRILNSGAFHLALTFGVPIVAPAAGTLSHLADPAYVRTFRPGSADDLSRAILSAVEAFVPSPEARHRARRTAEALHPDDVAQQFTVMLADALPGFAALVK